MPERHQRSKKKPKGWRTTLPIHPAAELFPLMSPAELKELAEDIKKNGLVSPVALWQADPTDPDSPLQLLDGRNRLDAIEIAAGSPIETIRPYIMTADKEWMTDSCSQVIVF